MLIILYSEERFPALLRGDVFGDDCLGPILRFSSLKLDL